jgi:hypothetical protein
MEKTIHVGETYTEIRYQSNDRVLSFRHERHVLGTYPTEPVVFTLEPTGETLMVVNSPTGHVLLTPDLWCDLKVEYWKLIDTDVDVHQIYKAGSSVFTFTVIRLSKVLYEVLEVSF